MEDGPHAVLSRRRAAPEMSVSIEALASCYSSQSKGICSPLETQHDPAHVKRTLNLQKMYIHIYIYIYACIIITHIL